MVPGEACVCAPMELPVWAVCVPGITRRRRAGQQAIQTALQQKGEHIEHVCTALRHIGTPESFSSLAFHTTVQFKKCVSSRPFKTTTGLCCFIRAARISITEDAPCSCLHEHISTSALQDVPGGEAPECCSILAACTCTIKHTPFCCTRQDVPGGEPLNVVRLTEQTVEQVGTGFVRVLKPHSCN